MGLNGIELPPDDEQSRQHISADKTASEIYGTATDLGVVVVGENGRIFPARRIEVPQEARRLVAKASAMIEPVTFHPDIHS